VLRTLTRFFRRGRDAAQLELGFVSAPPRDGDELLARLRQLGLSRIKRCRLTHNRNVMVSFGAGDLRVHEGYLNASDVVLRAIVTFVEGRTRAERRAAQRVIVSHPIRSPHPPARRDRTHEEDLEIAAKLEGWHARYNARYFHGRLKHIQVRVSRRMKSRLGHYTASTMGGEPAEIALSRAHLRKHGWEETLHTLLHEMVHQWQDETGHTIDHGATFRAKARELGIAPYARRVLATRPGRAAGSQTLGRRAARDG
jgi:hypothetical protein